MPRKRVDVTDYDREREGRREHVRDYTREQEVGSSETPSMLPTRRRAAIGLGGAVEMLKAQEREASLDALELRRGDPHVSYSAGKRDGLRLAIDTIEKEGGPDGPGPGLQRADVVTTPERARELAAGILHYDPSARTEVRKSKEYPGWEVWTDSTRGWEERSEQMRGYRKG